MALDRIFLSANDCRTRAATPPRLVIETFSLFGTLTGIDPSCVPWHLTPYFAAYTIIFTHLPKSKPNAVTRFWREERWTCSNINKKIALTANYRDFFFFLFLAPQRITPMSTKHLQIVTSNWWMKTALTEAKISTFPQLSTQSTKHCTLCRYKSTKDCNFRPVHTQNRSFCLTLEFVVLQT